MASRTLRMQSDTPPGRPRLPADFDQRKGLRWSLAFHAILFSFILIKTFVLPGDPLPFTPTLRVDLVGMPDALKNDLSKMSKAPLDEKITEALKQAEQEAKNVKPIPKTEPKAAEEHTDPNELVLKPTKRTQHAEKTEKAEKKELSKDRQKKMKSALDRIKSLEKITGESTTSKNHVASAIPIKGNRISQGNSLSGDAREGDQSQYQELVLEKLRENWALPVWLARQQLSAQVVIYIDGTGRVRSYRFVKPSGNPQFDDAVKRTIMQSQPFALPTAELASSMLVNGVGFAFPL